MGDFSACMVVPRCESAIYIEIEDIKVRRAADCLFLIVFLHLLPQNFHVLLMRQSKRSRERCRRYRWKDKGGRGTSAQRLGAPAREKKRSSPEFTRRGRTGFSRTCCRICPLSWPELALLPVPADAVTPSSSRRQGSLLDAGTSPGTPGRPTASPQAHLPGCRVDLLALPSSL